MVSENSPPPRVWTVGTALGGVVFGIVMAVGALVDWTPWEPPMTVREISVVVHDGMPASVLESRTTHRAFGGEWSVRVHRLDDAGVPKIVCSLPPDARGYTSVYATLGDSFLALPWDVYIGDVDRSCTDRLQSGRYVLVVARFEIVSGKVHALPLATSPVFEVTRARGGD